MDYFTVYLFYSPFVECLGIAGSILQVLLIGTRKVVGTREILLGTHVEIVVANVVEHGINALDGGNLDGTWG